MNKQRAVRLMKRIRREDPLCRVELRNFVLAGNGMFGGYGVACWREGQGFRVMDEADWAERKANIVFLAAHTT